MRDIIGRIFYASIGFLSGTGGTLLFKWYLDNYFFKTYAEISPLVHSLADLALGGTVFLFLVAGIAVFLAIYGDD